MSGQLNLFGAASKAAERRDRALEVVTHEPFATRAAQAILRLPSGWEGTGEDVRLALEAQGVVPHHHNAWGAVIMRAVRSGALRPTGEYRAMATGRSHARRTPVYKAG